MDFKLGHYPSLQIIANRSDEELPSSRHMLSLLTTSVSARLGNAVVAAPAAIVVILLATALSASGQTSSPASSTFRNMLMPEPSSLLVEPGVFPIDSSLTVGYTGGENLILRQAVARAFTQLEFATGVPLNKGLAVDPATAILQIQVSGTVGKAQELDEDESYTLEVRPGHIALQAETGVGAMRGLQTLLQLVQKGPAGYFFPVVKISDAPRFRWRGLMIDSVRHFEPVSSILRTLDGMEAVKLNVFHWHLSDDQGFRVESLRFPKLQGLGSNGLYYTQDQIRQVVAYASARGIRVIPEFDMPGHATSWFAGYPDLASGPGPYQVSHAFGMHDGAFDPTRESTFTFLDAFLGEMVTLFPDRYMHVGGDESNGKQWMANPRIQAFMHAHGIKDTAGLQVYFSQRVLKILTKHRKLMVGWDEILTPGLPKDIVVQSWRGVEALKQGATNGYQGILSAPYYLENMDSAGTLYLADPIPADSDLTASQRNLILGGEVCLWAEMVSSETLDSRIWPRMAAVAERFWSPATTRDVDDMYRRLQGISLRLDALGLQQISGPQRLQRLLSGTVFSPEFSVLTSVLEPVSAGARFAIQLPDQTTPLAELVDAVAPDPPSKHDFSQAVRELLANAPGQEQRRLDLQKLFQSWQNTAPTLEILMNASPRLANDAFLAPQLAALGSIGNDAFQHLQSHAAPPSDWQKTKAAELTAIGQQKSMVRFTVLESLQQLVDAAGEIKEP